MCVDRVSFEGPINTLIERRKMFQLQLKQKQLGNRYIANTMGNLERIIQNYDRAIQILTDADEELKTGTEVHD